MKKLFQVLTAFLLLLTIQPTNSTEAEHYQQIPDDAIRLRILAESDHPDDQAVKYAVRDAVNEEITEWVDELTDINQARVRIQNRLDQIDELVGETLMDYTPDLDYQVTYDSDVLFPTKLYDHYVYPAGEYEAILITLGEGKGSNWWCVLFPPLCFLDFSAGTTVENNQTEDEPEVEEQADKSEVSFFFLEWFR